MSDAELILHLPWVSHTPVEFDGVTVRRGSDNRLAYEDGIVLDVAVVDPAPHRSPEELADEVRGCEKPGRVVLVAGRIPVQWRGRLRGEDVSFLDVSGVVHIRWPRLRIETRRFGQPVKRRTAALPLQKGHALAAQELLISAFAGSRPSVGEVAQAVGVSLSSASRAVGRLAEQGLVAKQREGRLVRVSVIDPVELADHLAERTAWGRVEVLWGYLWGRNSWDIAARLSSAADEQGLEIAVTGRAGAAFLGVLGTADVPAVRCWVGAAGGSSAKARAARGDKPMHDARSGLADLAGALGLEPAPREEANVGVSADPWRLGLHRRARARFEEWEAAVAHPLRVWCDLHGEERGREFAAQLWGAVSHGP